MRPIVLGVLLALALLLVGGIASQPSVPRCPHCAVLDARFAHFCPGAQAVVGGVVCP